MLTSSSQLQKKVISRRVKNENVCEMSKNEKCTCKGFKTIVFHWQICKFVTFFMPSSSWLLKLPNVAIDVHLSEERKASFIAVFSLNHKANHSLFTDLKYSKICQIPLGRKLLHFFPFCRRAVSISRGWDEWICPNTIYSPFQSEFPSPRSQIDSKHNFFFVFLALVLLCMWIKTLEVLRLHDYGPPLNLLFS